MSKRFTLISIQVVLNLLMPFYGEIIKAISILRQDHSSGTPSLMSSYNGSCWSLKSLIFFQVTRLKLSWSHF